MLDGCVKSRRKSLNDPRHPTHERTSRVKTQVVRRHASTCADDLEPCALRLRVHREHYFADRRFGGNQYPDFLDRCFSDSVEIERCHKRRPGLSQEVRDEVERVGHEVLIDAPIVRIAPRHFRRPRLGVVSETLFCAHREYAANLAHSYSPAKLEKRWVKKPIMPGADVYTCNFSTLQNRACVRLTRRERLFDINVGAMACARLDEDAMCLWRREHVNNIWLAVAEHLFDIGKCGRDAMYGRKRLRCRLIEIAACDKRRVVNGPEGLGMHRCDAATADDGDTEAGGLNSAGLPTHAHNITRAKTLKSTGACVRPKQDAAQQEQREEVSTAFCWHLVAAFDIAGQHRRTCTFRRLDSIAFIPAMNSVPTVILAAARSPITFGPSGGRLLKLR